MMATGTREDGISRLRRSFNRSSSQTHADQKDVTYDTLVTNFMFVVAERKPKLVQEFPKIFRSSSTLEEMFSFMWTLNEAKEALSPKLACAQKNTQNAYVYWSQGNTCMRKGDRDQALNFYNMSLKDAPHPVITVNGKEWGRKRRDVANPTTEDLPVTPPMSPYKEGWGEFTALSHAYEARAQVLFSLKQYGKCMKDIDKVLGLGSPESVTKEIKSLKEKCESLGSLDVLQTEPAGEDNSVAFLYTSPEPPTLADPHPSYPCFSSAVEFACDTMYGRHMVAIREISTGEIVCLEKAYSAALYPKYFREYCTICLRRTSAPVPCPNCSTVIFCSEKCLLNGLEGCHKVECPLLHTLSMLKMSNNAVLLIRLVADIGYVKLKSMASKLHQEDKDEKTTNRGLDDAGVYNSSNYRTVYNLVTNSDKRGLNDLLKRTMETFVILKLLILSNEYFVDESGKKIDVKDDDLVSTGAMLMHHIMVLWCNADNIGEMQHDQKKSIASPVVAYGTGLFPSTSLLNHACYSTCASVSYGHMLVVRASRTIPAGCQVTRQYIDLYHKQIEQRVAIMKARYHFVCRCLACVGNWPHSLKLSFDYDLKCTVCGRPVDEQRHHCDKCNVPYKQDGKLEDRPKIITYKYSEVKRKMDELLIKYHEALPRFVEGSDTAEDIEAIKKLFDLYDEYAVLPTHGYVAVQSLLHAVCLRQGTSTFVKGDSLSLECMNLEEIIRTLPIS